MIGSPPDFFITSLQFLPKKTTNPNPSPTGIRFGFVLFGGPEGIRTHDLSDANRTLSQLSYRPILFGCYP